MCGSVRSMPALFVYATLNTSRHKKRNTMLARKILKINEELKKLTLPREPSATAYPWGNKKERRSVVLTLAIVKIAVSLMKLSAKTFVSGSFCRGKKR